MQFPINFRPFAQVLVTVINSPYDPLWSNAFDTHVNHCGVDVSTLMCLKTEETTFCSIVKSTAPMKLEESYKNLWQNVKISLF